MLSPPTGTVTFLFTDVEGSTRLWETQTVAMAQALARHDAILRETIEDHNGHVFKTAGDAFYAAFDRAPNAVAAALAVQKAVQTEPWPVAAGIRVRIALHTGSAEYRNNDYFGPPLNRTARLLGAAHGGQILLSDITQELSRRVLPPNAELRDLGVHALKDLPEPERVWQATLPALQGRFPPLRVIAATVHDLPQTLSVFVGRQREIADAEKLLKEPTTRLLTITGFGGMGKSRLAMEIARRSLPRFPEGVWWIPLETVLTGDALFTRLAEHLRLPLARDEGVRAQVCRALRERQLLLTLDNLEQIPDAAEAVRDLLAAAPGLVCLVTTQRLLALRGERVLELNTLPEADAIALFAERARDVRADFAVADENRADILRLCRRLEGMPLAIELAAARCAVMTPRQIVTRLGERFRLLQSRSPDLALRHRALLATIEWSYNLLPPDAQETLAQLSVFSGGFVMEDAEAVCETFDVFESLDTLHRHSLLRTETVVETQETRFLMLDSVCEFGEDRLRTMDGGVEPLHRRHAQWFLQRAEAQLAQLRTAQDGEALSRLDADADNLWSAQRRMVGNQPLFSQISLAIGRWRFRRGFLGDAVTSIQGGLDALTPMAAGYPDLCADLLRERAGLHLDLGETALARDRAQAARELSAVREDSAGVAKAENLLGQAAMRERDFVSARAFFLSALVRVTHTRADIEMAIVRNNLGLVERRDAANCDPAEREERLLRAETHQLEAERLFRANGDRRGLAEAVNNLGVVAYERENWTLAESYYRESLACEEAVHNTVGVATALYNLGEVAQRRGEQAREGGEYQRAVRLFAVSERLFEDAFSPTAADVADMLRQAALDADVSTDSLNALRAMVRTLPAAQRISFALSAEAA